MNAITGRNQVFPMGLQQTETLWVGIRPSHEQSGPICLVLKERNPRDDLPHLTLSVAYQTCDVASGHHENAGS